MLNRVFKGVKPPYTKKELVFVGVLFLFLLVIVGVLSFKVRNPQDGINYLHSQTAQAAGSSFIFTAGGDFGSSSNTTASLDLIASSGASFSFALGDLSYNETTPESAWCDYVKSRVGSTFPFELLAGNHEDNGPHGEINSFATCLPDRIGSLTGVYAKQYYFDHLGLARFILISPDLTIDGQYYDYSQGSTHYNWVYNAIDGARTLGIPWVIVGMHKNCITMGNKSCEIGADIMNLLIEKLYYPTKTQHHQSLYQ